MVNITLSVPGDVYERMKLHSEIRWSEVARKAIVERLELAERSRWVEKALKDAKLPPERVKELSKKINRAAELYIIDEYQKKH